MSNSRYHIGTNQKTGEREPKVCTTTPERCTKSDFHGSYSEVESAIEKVNQKDYGSVLPKPLQRKREQVARWVGKRFLKLLEDRELEYYYPEDLEKLGEEVSLEVRKRVSFDPNRLFKGDFEKQHINELKDKNREVFSEIVDNGKSFRGEVVTALRNQLTDEIGVLPDAIKEEDEEERFEITISNVGDEIQGKYERGIGKNRSILSFRQRRIFTVNKIMIPKYSDEHDNFQHYVVESSRIHEYSHHVVERVRERLARKGVIGRDSVFWNESENGEVIIPNKKHVGNHRELIPYATEEFFNPGVLAAETKEYEPMLYGADREDTDDRVLNFTIGFWVQQEYLAERRGEEYSGIRDFVYTC